MADSGSNPDTTLDPNSGSFYYLWGISSTYNYIMYKHHTKGTPPERPNITYAMILDEAKGLFDPPYTIAVRPEAYYQYLLWIKMFEAKAAMYQHWLRYPPKSNVREKRAKHWLLKH
jgi:hypothetical protein